MLREGFIDCRQGWEEGGSEHLEEDLVPSISIYPYLSILSIFSFCPSETSIFGFVILSQFPQERNVSEVMTELNNITTTQVNKTLTETVLMTSLHTLLRLVDFQIANGNNTSSEMNFTSVCKIASNLLDGANKATWKEIDSRVGTACFPGGGTLRHI